MDRKPGEASRDNPENMTDDERGIGLNASSSRTGDRRGEDKDDIGGTDEMGSTTGGLAGTSR